MIAISTSLAKDGSEMVGVNSDFDVSVDPSPLLKSNKYDLYWEVDLSSSDNVGHVGIGRNKEGSYYYLGLSDGKSVSGGVNVDFKDASTIKSVFNYNKDNFYFNIMLPYNSEKNRLTGFGMNLGIKFD